MVIISNVLLYIGFAILTGGLILLAVPEQYRPKLKFQAKQFSWAAFTIPLISFVPILNIYLYQYGQETTVLQWQQFVVWNMGQSWAALAFLAITLFIVLRLRAYEASIILKAISFILVLLMFVTTALVSHTGAVAGWQGVLAHISHFIPISVWIGVLLTVSIFSRENMDWTVFLRWFTPLAVVSVGMIIGSGIWMVPMVTTSYVGSWGMSYGQALLLKHVLFLGVLVYGMINGFLVRKRLHKNAQFQPRPWWRAESLIALGVFGVTAFMVEQAPPHDVAYAYYFETPSPLIQWFFGLSGHTPLAVSLLPNLTGALFISVGLLLCIVLLSASRTMHNVLQTIPILLFALSSLYAGIMLSVEITFLPEISQATIQLLRTLGTGAFCH